MGGLIAFGATAAGRITPDKLVLSAPALEAEVATWKRLAAPLLSRIVPMLRIPTGIGADTDPGQRLPNEDLEPPPYLHAVTTRLGDEAFRAQRAARAVVARGGDFPVETLVIHGTRDRLVRPEWCEPIGSLGRVRYQPLEGSTTTRSQRCAIRMRWRRFWSLSVRRELKVTPAALRLSYAFSSAARAFSGSSTTNEKVARSPHRPVKR